MRAAIWLATPAARLDSAARQTTRTAVMLLAGATAGFDAWGLISRASSMIGLSASIGTSRAVISMAGAIQETATATHSLPDAPLVRPAAVMASFTTVMANARRGFSASGGTATAHGAKTKRRRLRGVRQTSTCAPASPHVG